MDVLFFPEVSPPNVMFIFVFGTVVGSFLNVVVFRLGTGERMGNARSRCFSCGARLGWYDMVPLVSFLLQGGRCRYCGSRISFQYPLVEFVTGTVFALAFFRFLKTEFGIADYLPTEIVYRVIAENSIFTWFSFAAVLVLFSILIAISAYDARHKIIPNQLVYPFIIAAFFYSIIYTLPAGMAGFEFITQNFLNHIMAGIFAFAFFASLWFFSRGHWMGFGDAKLALGIGFFLGPLQTLFAVVVSFWIGTLIAVPIVLWKGGGLKAQIPFGPFLAAGCFAAWFIGDLAQRWYGFL